MEIAMDDLRGVLKGEIESGGDLGELPCPFCGLSRCERSSYIRCSKCGVNWGPEDDYSKDPRIDAYKEMVASAPKAAK